VVAVSLKKKVPEIPVQKSSITTMLEQLPKVIEKFSRIEDQTKKVVSDVGEVTKEVKENPSLLLRSPHKKDSGDEKKRRQP